MIVIYGDTAHDLRHFNGLTIRQDPEYDTYKICGLKWDYYTDAFTEVAVGEYATKYEAKKALRRIKNALEYGTKFLHI